MVGTLLATSIIEKTGRKQLLTRSYLGMGAAMLLMAAGALTAPGHAWGTLTLRKKGSMH